MTLTPTTLWSAILSNDPDELAETRLTARWEMCDQLLTWGRMGVCRCHFRSDEPVCAIHDLDRTGTPYDVRYGAYIRLAVAWGAANDDELADQAHYYAAARVTDQFGADRTDYTRP